jgi:haloalkane dehalogenase
MSIALSHASHEPTASSFAHPHSFVSAGEGKLAYYRFGQGPDVVLVHGWPLHSATFRSIVPHLAKRFMLHAFDLPGTGQTNWNGPVDFVSNAAALRHAIDAIGLSRYALLAHDSGGVSARLVAADDPRVQALILAGSEIPGHRPWLVQAYALAAKVPCMVVLIARAMAFGPLRRSFAGFGGCFSDPRYADGDFAELFVRPLAASRRAARGQAALLRAIDFRFIDGLSAVHARIRVPVFCIWGADDPFFPVAKARQMLSQFGGGAELVEIAGAKLFAHEDHPDAFAEHASAFLVRSLRAGSERAA